MMPGFFRRVDLKKPIQLDRSSFGKLLRAQRERRGLTQVSLAAAAGLTETFVAMLERGEREPSLDTACRLADALKCSVDKLRA